MAEILNPDEVLAALRDFGPLRRIILATPGTLQGTLSAFFGSRVVVEVRFQSEGDDEKQHFERQVELVCAARNLVVCRARTEIEVEDAEIRRLIRERRIGLGQIIQGLGVPTAFDLEAAGSDAERFWRVYSLEGPGFVYRIREEFPAALYPDAA